MVQLRVLDMEEAGNVDQGGWITVGAVAGEVDWKNVSCNLMRNAI